MTRWSRRQEMIGCGALMAGCQRQGQPQQDAPLAIMTHAPVIHVTHLTADSPPGGVVPADAFLDEWSGFVRRGA